MAPTPRRTLLVVALLAVVAPVAVGLFVIGGPGEARSQRLDARRVDDLSAIAVAVDTYWTKYRRLPGSLADLATDPATSVRSIQDPSGGAPYEYRVSASPAYELCARFERPSSDVDPGNRPAFWAHGAGRRCYALRASERGR